MRFPEKFSSNIQLRIWMNRFHHYGIQTKVSQQASFEDSTVKGRVVTCLLAYIRSCSKSSNLSTYTRIHGRRLETTAMHGKAREQSQIPATAVSALCSSSSSSSSSLSSSRLRPSKCIQTASHCI